MSETLNETDSNLDIAMYLEREVFTPALQEAWRKSMETGATATDRINGALNAYSTLLLHLLGGAKGAAGLLRAQADHLLSQPDGSGDKS